MKNKVLTVLVCILICFSSFSVKSQLIKNVNQTYLLMNNKEMFINKPISFLLSEIQPKVKSYTLKPWNVESPAQFLFRFISTDSLIYYRKNNLVPLTIRIYVKDMLSIDSSVVKNNDEWDENYLSKYGDLIISDISVFGGANMEIY